MSKTWIVLAALALFGCEGSMNGLQGVNFDPANKDQSNTRPEMACLDNRVDYVLNTEVVDFEMIGGGGINAGFSPSGIPLSAIGVGINYSQGQLQTMMHLVDPLKPNVPVVDIGGQATASNIQFSVDFTIALMKDGLNFWYQTPISQLSQNALTNNLTNLAAKLPDPSSTPWWTTVSRLNGSSGFFVPVGSSAGLMVGDELQVMDVTYEWESGTPCGGELLMPLINSTKPKAVAKVQEVSVDYAYLTIETQSAPILQYDYVTIGTLVQPPPPKCNNIWGCPTPSPRSQLGRSIRLGKLTSKPLPFTGQNGTTQMVDIAPFVLGDLQVLLPSQQFGDFYLHK